MFIASSELGYVRKFVVAQSVPSNLRAMFYNFNIDIDKQWLHHSATVNDHERNIHVDNNGCVNFDELYCTVDFNFSFKHGKYIGLDELYGAADFNFGPDYDKFYVHINFDELYVADKFEFANGRGPSSDLLLSKLGEILARFQPPRRL